MATESSKKKPIVNWFSRKKSISYGTKSVKGKTVKVKTKTVKAPDSVLSKGFTKKVVQNQAPKKVMDKRKLKAAIIAGTSTAPALIGSIASAAIEGNRERKNEANLNKAVDARQYDKVNEYVEKREKIKKQHGNVGKALAASIPIGLSAALAIRTNKRPKGGFKKTVTKTKNK
jgi:hypothetical protein